MTRFMICGAIALFAAGTGEAQTVCRPNTLGTVSCPGHAEPRPKDPFPDPKQGLPDHRASPDAGKSGPRIIPARRRNSFGDILPRDRDTSVRQRCEPDALGNYRCR